MKKLVIAGIHSGAGKTTVCAAFMRCLTLRGIKVAPFKTGPDYIDPKFHEFVTRAHSYNLDSWMIDEETVNYLFYKNSRDADIAVIEGVMGLFDGCGTGDTGSTAHIARITDSPVILVADAKGMSRSIAAMINGYCNFDFSIDIKGIILNRVSGERHYSLLKKIIEANCPVKCFGYIPSDAGIALESRHLGLVQAGEIPELTEKVNRMAELASTYLDIDGILSSLDEDNTIIETPECIKAIQGIGKGLKIGIALDKAFSFYYRDNISLMEDAGIELVQFSPLSDSKLPEDLNGLYIGGGYPEVFAAELSSNRSMLDDIKLKCMNGMPVYAECGGLMYLTSGVTDHNGSFFPMANFFNYRTLMTNRLQRFGYVNIGFEGIDIRGHEFHHSILEGADDDTAMNYTVTKESTGESWICGLRKQNVLAGYAHIHFYANLEFFKNLIYLFKGVTNGN